MTDVPPLVADLFGESAEAVTELLDQWETPRLIEAVTALIEQAAETDMPATARTWLDGALEEVLAGLRTPLYADVDEWVRLWLVPTIERQIGDASSPGACWCPWWWDHPEAVNRIYCMWGEWEAARVDGAINNWWLDCFEPHFAVLTGEEGPFHRCRPDHHEPCDQLIAEPAPAEILACFPEGAADAITDGPAAAGAAEPS